MAGPFFAPSAKRCAAALLPSHGQTMVPSADRTAVPQTLLPMEEPAMSRTLPRPHPPKSDDAALASSHGQTDPGHGSPAGLLYTILRHGQGLSHEAAQRRQREALDGPFFAA